ncbi:MAG: putative Se/S carrier-like protein [Clostridia bacterium]
MLATVASINSANRIRQYVSSKHNIQTKIIQTPSSLTKEGCGYSLRFEDKHKSIVSRAAKELNINIRSFFREEKGPKGTDYIKE